MGSCVRKLPAAYREGDSFQKVHLCSRRDYLCDRKAWRWRKRGFWNGNQGGHGTWGMPAHQAVGSIAKYPANAQRCPENGQTSDIWAGDLQGESKARGGFPVNFQTCVPLVLQGLPPHAGHPNTSARARTRVGFCPNIPPLPSHTPSSQRPRSFPP